MGAPLEEEIPALEKKHHFQVCILIFGSTHQSRIAISRASISRTFYDIYTEINNHVTDPLLEEITQVNVTS